MDDDDDDGDDDYELRRRGRNGSHFSTLIGSASQYFSLICLTLDFPFLSDSFVFVGSIRRVGVLLLLFLASILFLHSALLRLSPLGEGKLHNEYYS